MREAVPGGRQSVFGEVELIRWVRAVEDTSTVYARVIVGQTQIALLGALRVSPVLTRIRRCPVGMLDSGGEERKPWTAHATSRGYSAVGRP